MVLVKGLTEILNQIKPLKESKFRELMMADIDKFNANDEALPAAKENIQRAAGYAQNAWASLKRNSLGYDKKSLGIIRKEIRGLDPEIFKLNNRYNKLTGYNSPYYLKYAHFSNLVCKKITEIELARGWDE